MTGCYQHSVQCSLKNLGQHWSEAFSDSRDLGQVVRRWEILILAERVDDFENVPLWHGLKESYSFAKCVLYSFVIFGVWI